MDSGYDILGLGCAAVDDILYVDAYPPADAKKEILRRERHCGGLTTTALTAAARLGSRCGYAGVLGREELSSYIVERLSREGIDFSRAPRLSGVGAVYAIVVVDDSRTRTIFFDPSKFRGAHDDLPPEGVIASSRVLFVDHYGPRGMIRAARIARRAGVPVVADFESAAAPEFPELLRLPDHLILSSQFAEGVTGRSDPREMVHALWNPDREVVAVTCGEQGCWYADSTQPEALQFQRAFPVDAVDTTGCGDVFHGVYAHGLAQGWPLTRRMQAAAAAAALKATRRGGQSGVPTRERLEAFLREVET